MFNEVFSNLLNAAVVAGTVAYAAFAPTPVTTYVQHNGFACVRPTYSETMVINGSTPRIAKKFAFYLPCRDTLPVDKDGYLIFPEA